MRDMQPIHVGTINDMPVRFTRRRPTTTWCRGWQRMILARALGINRTASKKLLLRGRVKFPALQKLIRTEDGKLTNVLAFQGVQGLMAALKETRLATDTDHLAYVQHVCAAAQKFSPLLFDRDANGELRVSSPMIAMLLGADHADIVDRIEAIVPPDMRREAPDETQH